MNQRKIVLGNEHDEHLREVLVAVLKGRGGRPRSSDWGLGGSQEVSTLQVEIEGRCVVVEAETYIGLSITGEEDLVEKIAALVEHLLRSEVAAKKT